jgi:hypothetical protein
MAVSFDSKFEKGFGGASSPISYVSNAGTVTGTVGSGSNRVLIATLMGASDRSAEAVTWNGVSMTLISRQTVATGAAINVFGLKNPASGNQTLAASWTGGSAGDTVLGAASFADVDQTTAWQNVGTDTATSTSASSVVTTASGNMAVAVHFNDNASSTAISSGTSDWVEGALNGNYAMGHKASASGSETITWTLGSSVLWRNIKLDLLAASGGGGGTTTRRSLTGVGAHFWLPLLYIMQLGDSVKDGEPHGRRSFWRRLLGGWK